MTSDEYQQEKQSLLTVASIHDITSNKHWRVSRPSTNHRLISQNSLPLPSSERCLPLVMITDTNSSHTNIVELDTFEDSNYPMTDVTYRLQRQLKAPYRTRYSTGSITME
jgi:hypothetical protein